MSTRLRKQAAAEAEAAAADVIGMPAGNHAILSQVQQAVEGRARTLLANLDELDEEPSEQIVENNAKGKVADAG